MFLVCQNGAVSCLLLLLTSCFLEFYCVFRSQWCAADILIALKERSNADRMLHATIFPKWAHWKRSIREYHGPVSQLNPVAHQFRIKGEHRHLQLLLKQMYGMIRHMLRKESSAVVHFMHKTLLCLFHCGSILSFAKLMWEARAALLFLHSCIDSEIFWSICVMHSLLIPHEHCFEKWNSSAHMFKQMFVLLEINSYKHKPGLWYVNACLHIWYGAFCVHCRSCA